MNILLAASKSIAKVCRKNRKRIVAVLMGFVGGVAPLLITVANQLVNQPPNLPQKNAIQMILGMFLFAAAGAIVVFAVGELEPLKAFIQGIGAPAMIAVAWQQADAKKTTSNWNLLPQAYAQGPSSTATSIPGRVLEIRPKGDIHTLTVEFFDDGSRPVGKKDVVDTFSRISIPARATTAVFRKEASVSSPVALPAEPGTAVYYEVTGTEGRKEYNFLSSVTGKAEILYNLVVQKIPINILKPGDQGWAFVGHRENGDWTSTYLDFDERHPESGQQYTIQYYVTVLDKPADNASRLGRLVERQRVLVKEFRRYNSSPVERNQFVNDGDYYAQVTVIAGP
jgi:hypothetical protein